VASTANRAVKHVKNPLLHYDVPEPLTDHAAGLLIHPTRAMTSAKTGPFVVYKELNRIIYWSYTNFKEAVDHKTLFIDNEAMPASKGPIAVSTTGTAPAEGIRVYVQAGQGGR
jgi:hypothetical protein